MKFQLYLLVLIGCLAFTSCTFTSGKKGTFNLNDMLVKSKKSAELNIAYGQFKKEVGRCLLISMFQCNGRADQKPVKNEVTLIFFFYIQHSEHYMAKYIVNGRTVFNMGTHLKDSSSEFKEAEDLAILSPTKAEIREFTSHYDFSKMKDIEKNYSIWAKFMPDKLRNDTLSNEETISTQDYNRKFLPQNAEIIGKYLSIDDGDGNETFFIVYTYTERKKQVPYLEVYNRDNKQTFKLPIFDQKFLEADKNNKCRFYLTNHYDFVFENFTVSGKTETVVKQTKIQAIDLCE